jgi:NADPH2:quinone reductase
MPKAVRFHSVGGPEVLKIEEVPTRQPEAGEAVIKVEAVGLNRAESMFFRGEYLEKVSLPAGVGYEVYGTVTAVGPGGDASLVGKKRSTIPGYSMNENPSLAEEAVVPADALVEVPASLSAVQAAAVWMQYCTAWGAIVERGKVGQREEHDFVIVTAASSSVGLAAIQIARAEGATVIATTRTSAKKKALLEAGAHHVIATTEEDLPAKVKEISGGKGARVIFDPVGGDYLNVLADAAARFGTIYLYGFLSGGSNQYPINGFGKSVALEGYTFNVFRGTPQWETMKTYIQAKLADGTLVPKVDRTFALADVVEAYRYLESNQQVGKIVITV